MMVQHERLPVENLSVSRIRTDGGTQPRVAVSDEVVAEYADLYRQGEILPPVTVFHDGATYWLADGFHRYWATRKADRDVIAAEVRPGTLRDAILHSVGANATHGLRRTNADKRKAVLTLLGDEEWSAWSDRQIAKLCGVHHKTVSSTRELHTGEVRQYDSKDRTFVHPKTGKPTRMKTARIGRANRSKAAPKTVPARKRSTRKLAEPKPEEAAQYMVEAYGKEFMQHLVTELGHKGIGSTGETPRYRPDPDESECTDLEVYVDRATAAMGEIDLTVQPRANGQEFEDALSRPWSGRVWMFPPCIDPWVDRFCRKLIEHVEDGEVTEAVVLIKSSTETPWFQTLLSSASAVCFATGYIRFRHGDKTHAIPHGYAVAYLGPNPDRFRSEFETAGCVCSRIFTQPDGSESRASDMEVIQ